MKRMTRAALLLPLIVATFVALSAVAQGQEATASEAPASKAPPERTYSRQPFVHRILLLDEDGNVIRPPKPGEQPAPAGGPPATVKPVSLAKTCGKCHSDYDAMQHGWHFNFADAGVP